MAIINLPTRLMNIALISGLIALLAAVAAFACGAALMLLPIKVVLWHTAAAALVVSLASTEVLATKTINVFGKLDDGTIPFLRWLLFLPFHAIAQTIMVACRLLGTEEIVSEIEDGWYLGGMPTRVSHLPPGPTPALMDLTCEMPRRPRVGAAAYKSLPCWETHGLDPEKIEEGVEWALQQRHAGHPIYCFCTHGHGRSAVMLCALLIADGLARDPREAWRKVSAARPGARPNHRQRSALERWFEQYGSKGRSNEEVTKGQ